MKNETPLHTSQAYDRKHRRDHISNNPRAAKEQLNWEDTHAEDKRASARHEHSNHFTSRSH